MWETICDALHIPLARNVGSKFLECPHSSISGMLVWSPPTPKWKFGQILPPTPPHTHRVSGSSYVETNCCIPRGYHLVGLASYVREHIVLVNSCNLCESKYILYYRILVLLKWRNVLRFAPHTFTLQYFLHYVYPYTWATLFYVILYVQHYILHYVFTSSQFRLSKSSTLHPTVMQKHLLASSQWQKMLKIPNLPPHFGPPQD